MIGDDKQYEYIGSVITDRLDRVRDAFKLFLQLFSGIVGGSIWLSTQQISPAAREFYVLVSDALVILVVFVTGTMVYEALRGWWGYREALAELTYESHPAPRPKLRAVVAEVAMLVGMVAAAGIYVCSNPFAVWR